MIEMIKRMINDEKREIQEVVCIKRMSQMNIGGPPTLGSDSFEEYSSIMKEPLSASVVLLKILQNC